MDLIGKRFIIDRIPSMSGPGGVPPLQHEPRDQPVENSIIIVPFKTQLDEVLAGFGALGCPELDLQFPMTRVHDHFR